MAAATQSQRLMFDLGGGERAFRLSFSVMTSDQLESLSYNYADCPAVVPIRMTYRIKTAPTARCGVFAECDLLSANASAKTVPIRFYTEGGGDITGAVMDVTIYFPRSGAQPTGLLLAA